MEITRLGHVMEPEVEVSETPESRSPSGLQGLQGNEGLYKSVVISLDRSFVLNSNSILNHNVFDKRVALICEWPSKYRFLGFQGKYNNHFIKKPLINYPN
jgi:hypothetical protein